MEDRGRTALRRLSYGVVLALAGSASGCASIKSTNITEPKSLRNGVVYYLPTQHLVVTLTVTETQKTEDGVTTITFDRAIDVSPTAVVPDLEHRYLLAYQRNHIGVSKAAIKVGVNGLLEGESTGSTTSEIEKVLEGIATSLETTQTTAGDRLSKPPNACAAPGVYRWVAAVDGREIGGPRKPGHTDWLTLQQCALSLSAIRLAGGDDNDTDAKTAGVFYRQALPMVVQVDDWFAKITTTYTPSLVSAYSPTNFLPVPRTVFSNVTWKLNFTNGIPTVYEIDAGSDVLGLVTLPAEVIAAYSKAITAGFTSRKGELDAEAEYMKALAALAAQQIAAEACRVAVNGGDPDKIRAACKAQ